MIVVQFWSEFLVLVSQNNENVIIREIYTIESFYCSYVLLFN